MNWGELVDRVADRSGCQPNTARQVLTALSEVVLESAENGDDIPLRKIGSITSRWVGPRTVRSVNNSQKTFLDGRFVARFRPSGTLKQALLSRTPQVWREPGHQQAWRLAETLVGDLALYHADLVPTGMDPHTPLHEVEQKCKLAMGGPWTRAMSSYEAKAPPEARGAKSYLLVAARRHFSCKEQP